MKNKVFSVIVVVLFCFTFIAWGLTTVTGQRIINSTIDSTPIGSSSPNSGAFSTLSSFWSKVTSFPPATLATNEMVTGFNATNGGGEGDFFVNPGSGSVGGYRWFNTANNTWNAASFIMSLDSHGNLVIPGNIGASGGIAATNGFTGSLTGTVNGNVNGNLNGNANTSSAFDHTPATCPAGQSSSGVNSAGNAVCVNAVINGSGTSCTTGAGSFSTCNSVVSWSPGFADNNYRITCTVISPSDPRLSILGVANKFDGSANVTIVTEGSASVTFASLDCMVQHN